MYLYFLKFFVTYDYYLLYHLLEHLCKHPIVDAPPTWKAFLSQLIEFCKELRNGDGRLVLRNSGFGSALEDINLKILLISALLWSSSKGNASLSAIISNPLLVNTDSRDHNCTNSLTSSGFVGMDSMAICRDLGQAYCNGSWR